LAEIARNMANTINQLVFRQSLNPLLDEHLGGIADRIRLDGCSVDD
jgi:hypothetical protein